MRYLPLLLDIQLAALKFMSPDYMFVDSHGVLLPGVSHISARSQRRSRKRAHQQKIVPPVRASSVTVSRNKTPAPPTYFPLLSIHRSFTVLLHYRAMRLAALFETKPTRLFGVFPTRKRRDCCLGSRLQNPNLGRPVIHIVFLMWTGPSTPLLLLPPRSRWMIWSDLTSN